MMFSAYKTILICLFLCSSIPTKTTAIIQESNINSDVKISCFEENKLVGFLYYRKIPLTSFYTVHSLYVYPHYRGKGYAKALLEFSFTRLKEIEASCIYIQPGPFEIKDSTVIHNDGTNKENLRQLVTTYKRYGFEPVHKATRIFAKYMYKIVGINEDAEYLLVKKL